MTTTITMMILVLLGPCITIATGLIAKYTAMYVAANNFTSSQKCTLDAGISQFRTLVLIANVKHLHSAISFSVV